MIFTRYKLDMSGFEFWFIVLALIFAFTLNFKL